MPIFFSVIVPTYKRPQQLSNCLSSLARLDYSYDSFEVIVADDGSGPPIADVIKNQKSEINITHIKIPHSGPASARNTGAMHARGEVLTFIDDDCFVSPDLLLRLDEHFSLKQNYAIGGRTLNKLEDNIYSSVSQLIFDTVYKYYNTNHKRAQFLGANNLSISKSIFMKMGGFNPEFRTSEDRDFCDRLISSGINLVYDPDLVVYHAHELNFVSFCRQHFNYGRGAYKFLKTRNERKSFNFGRIINFHLNFRNWFIDPIYKTDNKLHIAALVFLWQIVNLSGVCWESISQFFSPSNN